MTAPVISPAFMWRSTSSWTRCSRSFDRPTASGAAMGSDAAVRAAPAVNATTASGASQDVMWRMAVPSGVPDGGVESALGVVFLERLYSIASSIEILRGQALIETQSRLVTDVFPPVTRVGRSVRRKFYVALAVFLFAMIVVGFWPSYYGPLVRGAAKAPIILHIHGAIFIGWMLLLIAQTAFAARGDLRTH